VRDMLETAMKFKHRITTKLWLTCLNMVFTPY